MNEKLELLDDLPPKIEESDEEILAEAIKLPVAFGRIIDRYEEPLLRKARYMLGGESEDAEDIVQEAFVKMYCAAPRFKKVKGATFKSWAYKILVNTCLTFLKKRKRNRAFTLPFDPELHDIIADDQSEEKDRKLFIDEALSVLSRMPEAFREVLRPTLIEGKTQSDVGRELGLSPGALRTRVHRAKKEFKKISLSLR